MGLAASRNKEELKEIFKPQCNVLCSSRNKEELKDINIICVFGFTKSK